MDTTQTPAIMLRAKITNEEWTEIRKEALDRRVHASERVAELLRKGRECERREEGSNG